MALTWKYDPARENHNARHLAEASGLAVEVVETSGGGPWMVTVRRGREIVGVHRMAADADAGKRLAEELVEGAAKVG